MAEPTLVAYSGSNFGDVTGGGADTETTGSFTWLTGDRFYVFGLSEDDSVTIALPTVAGLTFSQVTVTSAGSNTKAYLWEATAASGGSGAITSTGNSGSTGKGLAAFQFRGSDGRGTPVTIVGSTAKTISVTRGQANSHVILAMGDWAEVGDVTVTASPGDGTQRVAQAISGRFDAFVFSWGDQGGTGTTAYGITNHTGTVDMTGIAVEVLGTAGGGGGGATLSAATPSGTLATVTTATLGATSDQTTGTFYGVVDTAGNISGITAAQIKAGQNKNSVAAVAASNSAVSTTTPSSAVSGLTANTAYSYAVVQNNANGDSNVLTGTFTTAVTPPLLLSRRIYFVDQSIIQI